MKSLICYLLITFLSETQFQRRVLYPVIIVVWELKATTSKGTIGCGIVFRRESRLFNFMTN